MSSKAQLLVNGEAVRAGGLKTQDEIAIGKYRLKFFGDHLTPVDQLYEGRMHHEIPDYRVNISAVQDATHHMSKAQLNHMREIMRRQSGAVVIREDDDTARWKPGGTPLGFGKQQAVAIRGWLAGGHAATLQWDGGGHKLQRQGLTKVRVNGVSIDERVLRDGDRFSIGASSFRYILEG